MSRILDLYESQAEATDRKRSVVLVALMSVAALLVGLAVQFLIGYNWQSMPTALKLVISFYDFNAGVYFGYKRGGVALPSVIMVIAVVAIALAALAQHSVERAPVLIAERIRQIMQQQWLPLGLVILMEFLTLWNAIVGEPLLPTITANVAMVAVSVWLMRAGLRDDRTRLIAAGAMYFLLWAVLRYIDLFGDFGGMLGAAMMFLLCRATLFGVALYWRRRKAGQDA